MPYIYFFILLIFLVLYSFFITLEIYKSIKFELFYQKFFLGEINLQDLDLLFYTLRAFRFKRLWFNALQLLESQRIMPIEKQPQFFNAIGVIYQEMKEYNLAKLYYLQSLDKKEDYSVGLNNLLKLKNK